MKNLGPKAVFLAVLLPAVIFIGGCEEENRSDPRKCKLLAEDNYRLTKELQNCHEKINEEIKLREKLKQEHKKAQHEAEESVVFLMDTIAKDLGKENAQLREENRKLTEQIEQLKNEIEDIKKQQN